AYQYGLPTPGNENSCKQIGSQQPTNYPYGFAGQSIKKHGKKMVINVLWALKNINIVEVLTSGPVSTASVLLNLSEEIIKRFQKTYEQNLVDTPARRKNVRRPVRDEIDSKKQRIIYDVLVSYYKENRTPKLSDALEKFVERVRIEQLSTPDAFNIPPKLFHCGVNTFREILHSLGYKFGKINKRDAVLFDP
ncbi:unnamed protein product, partial [Allacma fusca]